MKMSQMNKIKVGDKVTCLRIKNTKVMPTQYEVITVGPGSLLTIREKKGYRPQMIDISQVVNHISLS